MGRPVEGSPLEADALSGEELAAHSGRERPGRGLPLARLVLLSIRWVVVEGRVHPDLLRPRGDEGTGLHRCHRLLGPLEPVLVARYTGGLENASSRGEPPSPDSKGT